MRDNVVSDTYAHLLQPDTLLPSQYFAALKRKAAHEPERRLAVAVLQDAVDCFQKHLRARDRKAHQLFCDAEEWICSDDRSWPFSFENICDLLQINAEYLRCGLIAWRDTQRDKPPACPKVVSLNSVFPRTQGMRKPLQRANAR